MRPGRRRWGSLGIAVHRGTLLRLVIDLPEPTVTAAPEVLGVDLSRFCDYPDCWMASVLIHTEATAARDTSAALRAVSYYRSATLRV